MRPWMLVCVTLLTGGAAATLMAHDPHADTGGPSANARTWRHVAADLAWRGTFLAARDGEVSIQSDDGPVITLQIARLAPEDQAWVAARRESIVRQQGSPTGVPSAAPAPKAPWQAATFAPFAPYVTTRSDERWLYVESDGLPHAPLAFTMMKGIRAWQQQVPLPQRYTGANAWQIPLRPVMAKEPVSGKTELRRGAIALAANGLPIFNALNNRGEDAFAIGELDEFGGHCGRADDYHYHVAPLALAAVVGPGKPIAFALDGYPIYGLFDPAAKPGADAACPRGCTDRLDALNGHGAGDGYHYHASKSYPYINGGMRGEVRVEGDQIVPQPRTDPVREAGRPLRGATITDFASTGPRAWRLTYEIAGKPSRIEYSVDDAGMVHFVRIAADGTRTEEEFRPAGGREPREANEPRDGRPERRGRDGGDAPRRDAKAPPPRDAKDPPRAPAAAGFLLSSPVVHDGVLPAKYTCDGESIAPPFAWHDLPKGTKALALTIHHVPPDGGEKVYYVVEGIPADATGLAEGTPGVGRLGRNSLNDRAEYAPPCSKGPGEKRYVATLYALSEALPSSTEPRSRAELLRAIGSTTIATASLELRYTRSGEGKGERAPRESNPPANDRPRDKAPPANDRPRPGLLAQMTSFHTDVPERPFDVVLVQPTDRSIGVSVMGFGETGPVTVAYERAGGKAEQRTASERLVAGSASLITLDRLEPDCEYRYAVTGEQSHATVSGRFHTQRRPGQAFTFTIQADSHLDANMDPAAYVRTLDNALADRPDFHVDLGDTFMTDKRSDFHDALPQYDAQRYYFGRLCASAPLFMALGNHDGEAGWAARGDGDIATWSYARRTERFPPPVTGAGFYAGQTALRGEGGARRGNHYYAFTWGDAQCIVLDPFWSTMNKPRGGRNASEGVETKELVPTDSSWERTLGREQYDWLKATLEASSPRYRFIFLHHLVGGLGREGRGGVEASPFFEWGGKNADGSAGFADHRPGWPMPIHELLVKHGVAAVFHGHDHLYVKSERDGLIYQCVPQPGNPNGGTRSASEYGYVSGEILGSPGHLRVRVSPEATTVDFVRAALPGARNERDNGSVAASYAIQPRRTTKS